MILVSRQYLKLRGRTVVNGGICTVVLPMLNRERLLTHIRVWSDSTTDTGFTLYAGVVSPENTVEVAPPNTGNNNFAAENPPILLEAGTTLIGQWINVSAMNALGSPTSASLIISLV